MCRATDLANADYAALSGAQKARLRQHAEENAREERSETLRRIAVAVAERLRQGLGAVGSARKACRLWRERHRARTACAQR